MKLRQERTVSKVEKKNKFLWVTIVILGLLVWSLNKNMNYWKEAAKAHGEFFSKIQPACTFVEVSRFINPEWLIEIEADAVLDK